jgi:hypothetical protein
VDHVGDNGVSRHREPDRKRLQRGGVRRIGVAGEALPRGIAAHAHARARQVALAEAAHFDLGHASERPAQVIDRDSAATVDVGRIFPAEEQDIHACYLTPAGP